MPRITIFLDISILHFKDGLNPRNFADLSQFLFPVVAPTAPAAPAPAGGALTTPAGSLSVTNVFNYAALPSNFQLCYCQHADRSLRSTMVIEVGSSIPNKTLDPTGATMRTTLSYLDPHITGDRLITRNCAVFTLTSQGPDGTKEFLRTVPSCRIPDDSANVIRAWYAIFSIPAANHGIFVQPYFCFRLDANATTGFTIGDDIDLLKFDVPGKFSDCMSSLLTVP